MAGRIEDCSDAELPRPWGPKHYRRFVALIVFLLGLFVLWVTIRGHH